MTAPSRLERVRIIKETLDQLAARGEYRTLNYVCKQLLSFDDSWAYRDPDAKAVYKEFSDLMVPVMLEKLKNAIAQLDEQKRFLKLESLCNEFGIDYHWAKGNTESQRLYREWAENRKDEMRWYQKYNQPKAKPAPEDPKKEVCEIRSNGNGHHEKPISFVSGTHQRSPVTVRTDTKTDHTIAAPDRVMNIMYPPTLDGKSPIAPIAGISRKLVEDAANLPRLAIVDDVIETEKALVDALTDMGDPDLLDDLQKRVTELERQNQRLKEENQRLKEGQGSVSLEDAIRKEISEIDRQIQKLEAQVIGLSDRKDALIGMLPPFGNPLTV